MWTYSKKEIENKRAKEKEKQILNHLLAVCFAKESSILRGHFQVELVILHSFEIIVASVLWKASHLSFFQLSLPYRGHNPIIHIGREWSLKNVGTHSTYVSIKVIWIYPGTLIHINEILVKLNDRIVAWNLLRREIRAKLGEHIIASKESFTFFLFYFGFQLFSLPVVRLHPLFIA